jgi:hypothetical protein
MRTLLLFITSLLAGCGSGYPPPEGFVDSCYGGNWNKNMVGKSPTYLVTLDIEQHDWVRLRNILNNYSKEIDVDYFDTSIEKGKTAILSLSVCSKDGLWIHFDKRRYGLEDPDVATRPMNVSILIYSNPEQWKTVPKKIDELLRNAWPSKVNSDHGMKSTYGSSLL